VPVSSPASPVVEPAHDAARPADLTATVVICAYTELRFEQILAAVESVRSQLSAGDDCVVVVDHNDVLRARLAAVLPEDVEVIANDGPRGLSGARNAGVARATGDVVVFLDDDAVAEPTFLARLMECYDDPAVAGAGGSAVPVWPAGRPRWFPEEFDWVVGCSYRGLPEVVAPVRNLIGAGMSYRRSALAAAGPFDPLVGRIGRRPLGCEETELSIRLRAALPESELLHVPGAVVRHTVSPERVTFSYFFGRCFAEGRSKALVAERVGSRRALASERRHALHELPAGVARALRSARSGDRAALGRAAMIVVGLLVTSAGYALATAARACRPALGTRRPGA
jgi:GT2 family glycosyltransferase